MKSLLFNLLTLSILIASCTSSNNKVIGDFDFNDNWKFHRGDIPEAQHFDFNDERWDKVSLPHDWSIGEPFSKDNPAWGRGAWLPAGICYYRKTFELPDKSDGKKISVYFDGVYRRSDVWINGNHLGYRPYGYIAFEYDLTPYINYNGRNVITVKLDNSSQPGSRWYTGTGIYRNITLKIRDNLYIPTWGIYVTTPVVQEDEAQINYEVKVKNEYTVPKDFNIQISLIDPSGNVVNTISHPENLEANAEGEFTYTMPVNNPLLWSPENPHLYQVVCNIYDEGQKIGARKVKTGIRGMQYDANRGFILNGKKVVLNGVCMHHDGGPLGAACYRRTYEREIETLKEMGCNAIRTSHNPYASEFLDVCDSMGMLVMAEAFDVWEEMKKPRVFLEDGSAKRIAIDQYHKEFPEWSNRDLRDMILRDRNHPSVFMWSIGNEIPEMREEAGVPITKRLGAIVHEYDYRPFTNGTNYRHPANQEAVSATDIAGYNYATHEILVADHKDFPDRKMIITECSSAQPFRARGEYYLKSQIPHQHDILWKGVKRNRINRRDEFGQGIDSYLGIKGKPYVMGMFIWTGKDYLGEITPYSWPARSSSFGVIDLCGFKKIGYYFYQSLWTDKPVMKIYPHWNWEGHEGEKVSVKCFSNADEIELFLNGTSLGRQKNNLSNGIIPEWDVPYEKGELQAKGFKNGNKISEDRVVTAKEPANIQLTSRKDYLNHNGKDLVYVECEVLDEDGNLCPKADNMIHFQIEGDAKIIGVGNGYNKSHEPFQANYRKAYNGKCLAILKSGTQGGVVKISASADGLQSAELLISDKKNL